MENVKTSTISNGVLWFGAAVSIAEIFTGTSFAPLGFSRGIAAIILGHIIGCILLYFAGLIGAKTGKSAMETVKISFGSKGSIIFSISNVIQLLGWTAVMIIMGAKAAGVIADSNLHIKGYSLWCIVIGVLIILWILAEAETLSKLNGAAVGALFVLTIVLCIVIFRGHSVSKVTGSITFGQAVELAATMPISWLPLISDYTKNAKQPNAANAVSVVTYFFTSSWMFIIGLGAVIFLGQSDIAQIMLNAGLGIMGIIIMIFSTVTTTYLDAYSAGVSFFSITNKVKEKWIAVTVCIAGTLLAIFTPIEQYENFLYFIGSVFAPMIAILIADYFILKKDYTDEMVNITNIILWVIGFAFYRYFMSVDFVMGNTVPVMIIIIILSILAEGGKKLCLKKS